MKKTLTVLIAAGALLGAAGCSAPKLSNEATCARIKTVVSSPTATSDKAGMTRLANQLRPIEAAGSDDLKAPLKAIIDFFDESAKDSPDSVKLEGLKANYSAAGQTYTVVCAGGQ
jgi:ABC-type glycerol-3-phosphate transport system substrate-binding protein